MAFFSKLLSLILSVIITLAPASTSLKTTSQRAKDFRLVAYVVGNGFENENNIDATHFEDLTDVILFGVATFDTEGNVNLQSNFEKVLSNLKNAMEGSQARLWLNLLGPGFRTSSPVWEEQMDDQGNYHDMAFRSGNLEGNIKSTLEKYGFDGIMFDYEYPHTKAHWKVFDSFIISLDKVLGDEYMIGCAISAWNTSQSRKAIKCLDLVEVMAYDIWDDDGTHASLLGAQKCVNQMLLDGYSKDQMDMGIPFYARPTNHGAYWYGYDGWYTQLDENGFCVDPGTGLTFSFNTYDMVYEKTQWAIKAGLGGAMVWHYSCDIAKDNSLSLFNAMANAKADLTAESSSVC